ncbi:MAG: MBL fold metallo-hydrolase [Parvularculaceae bacterium]|nr:MBL fold metallo-hydrolase [Parvularculaceae bacterium]
MKLTTLIAAGLLIVYPANALAQRDFSEIEITTQEVAPGVYMLQGAGGNIGLSTGPDGAFMIDDQFAPLSAKILAAIAKVSDEPVKFLVNTHWHGDHSGGNEAFADRGAVIIAHENVRTRLKEGLKRASGETPPAPYASLPVITFSDSVNFYWNGQSINVRHPAPAHTDGDAIISFRPANVVHMGDTFFNGAYPYIDIESGGDLDGVIAAHEATLGEIDDNTKIIPGHGPLSAKKDLERYLAMLKDVRARVQALVDSGLDENAAVKADPLKDLNGEWGTGFIDGEAMTRAAYRSLTRNKTQAPTKGR